MALLALFIWMDPAMQAASVPELMSFQGYLTDGAGAPLGTPNPETHPVTFRIYAEPSGGSPLWEEQQQVTVDNGNFSVILGQAGGTPSLSTVVDQVRYIGTWIDISGTPTEILPRLRLLPTPYAFLASKVVSVQDNALTPNVPLKNTANLFTANQTIDGVLKVGTGSDGINIYNDGNNAVWANNKGFSLFYNPPAGGYVWTIGNEEKARINSDGRVGIGTVAPSEKLHVNGNVKVDGSIDATSVKVNGTNNLVEGVIPFGGIIMWSGDLDKIPTGWRLCNGLYGTPDLRDRFIIGSGGNIPHKSTGGSSSITLSENQLPAHRHTYQDDFWADSSGQDGPRLPPNGGYRDLIPHSSNTDNSGVGTNGAWDNDNNRHYYTTRDTFPSGGNASINLPRPPYYALAFIMRVSASTP